MFDEIFKYAGTVRIPTGAYVDSQPTFTNYPVTYFRFAQSVRNPQTGELQREDTILIKSATLTDIPANSKFIDKAGESFDLKTAIPRKNFELEVEMFTCVVAS